MHNISQEEVDRLTSFIPDYPGVAIFHMTNDGVDFVKMLQNYCDERDYAYHPVSVNAEFVEALHANGVEKARQITYGQQRYNQHSKLYDYIYIEIDPLSLDKPQLFLKKIYAISKNAAKILFFLPEEGAGFEALEKLLEEGNFVAINPIDDMFENYHVLSAQKMHGWGIYDMR